MIPNSGKRCPRCGSPHPLDAPHCQCGHHFRTQFTAPPVTQTQAFSVPTVVPGASPITPQRHWLAWWWYRNQRWVLLALVIAVLAGGLFKLATYPWFAGTYAHSSNPSSYMMINPDGSVTFLDVEANGVERENVGRWRLEGGLIAVEMTYMGTTYRTRYTARDGALVDTANAANVYVLTSSPGARRR